jgi:hypothetical protein
MCMQCGRSDFNGCMQAEIACLHLTPTEPARLDASGVPSQPSPLSWTAVIAGNGSHDWDSMGLEVLQSCLLRLSKTVIY